MSVAPDAAAPTKSAEFATGTVGSVTYGGVNVPLDPDADAHDTATEVLDSYIYFLGSGIATSAQTVEIKDGGGSTLASFTHTPVGTPRGVLVAVSRNATIGRMVAWAHTVTAAADTAIEDVGVAEENQADPLVALVTGASVETYGFCLITSGFGSAGALGSGPMTTQIDSHDYGQSVALISDTDANDAGGGFTVQWSTGGLSEDVAMVAVAIKETAAAPPAAAAQAPTRMLMGVGT